MIVIQPHSYQDKLAANIYINHSRPVHTAGGIKTKPLPTVSSLKNLSASLANNTRADPMRLLQKASTLKRGNCACTVSCKTGAGIIV